nr:PAS domain-containing sensor histidine kinase [uncultured Methanospirillum sp.]
MKPSECPYSKSGNTISNNQNLDQNNAFNSSSKFNNQDEYKKIFNNLPGICFQSQYLDSTIILHINHKIHDNLGYTPESLTQNQILFDTLIHRSDYYRRKKSIETALSRLEIYNVDYRLRHANGRYLWVNELGQISKNSSGIYEITGFIRKIDELDKSIESCMYQVDLYRTIFDSVPELIVVVDSKSNIIDINKTMEKKFSVSFHKSKGKDVDSLIPGLSEFLHNSIEKPHTHDPILVYKRSEEIEEYFKIITIPFHEKIGHKKGTVCIAHDVSDLIHKHTDLEGYAKKLEKSNEILTCSRDDMAQFTTTLEWNLIKQKQEVRSLSDEVMDRNRMVEQLLKQKDMFINNLAHDLRTPLTPVIALIPLLKEYITDAHLLEIIRLFEIRIGYLREMVEDIISYAHLNSQVYIDDYMKCNLFEFIEDIFKQHTSLIEGKQIQVKNQIPRDLVLRLSRSQAPVLFNNLILNAIQFNSISGSITVTGVVKGEWCSIQIVDTGSGIPGDMINYIWEDFAIGDPSRSDPVHKGLGLSMVKKIVALHRGYIIATSEGKEKGTTFTLTLPLVPVPEIP